MKIKYIKGDLFDTDYKVIVHGCNAQGVMGSGVAKTFKQRFPNSYQKYNKFCLDFLEANILGQVVINEEKNKWTVCAITQKIYGRNQAIRYCDYDAIARCMKKIDGLFPGEHIAMPMIGAGLANGDWNVISTIIESEFKDAIPVVYQLE